MTDEEKEFYAKYDDEHEIDDGFNVSFLEFVGSVLMLLGLLIVLGGRWCWDKIKRATVLR